MKKTRTVSCRLVTRTLLMSLIMAISPARAAVGPNGQIAFAFSEFCCDFDIWVMNPDGTGQTNLTNTPTASEGDPSWSPDGTKITYNREGDIWVMNADGTDQTNLTNSPEVDFGADWAPDGARLVFTRVVPGQVISDQFDIFTMNADGTAQTNITNSDFDELEPAWAPGGTKIAVAAVRIANPEEGADWEIVTMNTDGTGESILTLTSQEDRAPDWSPDGTKIVWMSAFDNPCCGDWEIWAMNDDGTGQTNITNNPAGDIEPSWSPDGTQITFLSNRDIGFSFDVYAMDAPATLPPGLLADQVEKLLTPVAVKEATRLTTNGNTDGPDWGTNPGGGGTTFILMVSKIGTGTGLVRTRDLSINCGTDCSQDYISVTTVTLQAVATPGSVFAGWSGACTGTGTTCTLSVDASKTATATFNSSGGGMHTLSVTRVGSGAVRSTPAGIQCGSDCTEAYAAGALVKLTAISAKGWGFTKWSGACTGTATTCTVAMDFAKAVTATFTMK